MTNQRSSNIILGIVFVAFLASAGYGWFNAQETAMDVSEIEEPVIKPITIGVLVSFEHNLAMGELLAGTAEARINQYCVENGLPFNFTFITRHADRQAAVALGIIQEWSKEGINLVVGPPWSSMVCAGRSYAEDNGIVLMSPQSTSPLLAIEDNVIRLMPPDWYEADIISDILADKGVKAVVCIERGDSWAEGITAKIQEQYTGEFISIRYPAETTSFIKFLDQAQIELEALHKTYTQNETAIVLVAFDEAVMLLEESMDYPDIQRVHWYGTVGTVNSQRILDNSGEPASNVKLTSPTPIIPENTGYTEMNKAFQSIEDHDLHYYDANIYDGCWIYALAVIQEGTTNSPEIISAIPQVAANYTGLTGPYAFDQFGDRISVTYGLYDYIEQNETYTTERVGEYNLLTRELYWYPD